MLPLFQSLKQQLSPQVADRRGAAQRERVSRVTNSTPGEDDVDLEGLNSTPQEFYEADCDPVEYELALLGDKPTPERIREMSQARTRSLQVRFPPPPAQSWIGRCHLS